MGLSDWLFQWPEGRKVEDRVRILQQWLESDPVAGGISDLEAEEFLTVAWMLWQIEDRALNHISVALRVGSFRTTDAGRRRGILALLRSWRNPTQRELLLLARQYVGYGPLSDIRSRASTLTMERLEQVFFEGVPVWWLIAILRMTGREDRIPTFLENTGNQGRMWYQASLLNGRAMMRRILDGVSQPWCTPNSQLFKPGQDEGLLARRLREKESALNTLTGDFKAGERSRGDWKQAARRAALEAEDQLRRARAEVAAAAEELDRRRSVHRREMDDLAAQGSRRLEHLRERLASERRQFAEALAERAARCGAAPLLGWSVSVSGADAEPETYRLLVESAGGRLVAEGADIAIALGGSDGRESAFRAEGTGLAAFERTLCRQVIPWVLRHRTGRQ